MRSKTQSSSWACYLHCIRTECMTPSISSSINPHSWSVPQASLASVPTTYRMHFSTSHIQVFRTSTSLMTGCLSIPMSLPVIRDWYIAHGVWWKTQQSPKGCNNHPKLSTGLTKSQEPVLEDHVFHPQRTAPLEILCATSVTVLTVRSRWIISGGGARYMSRLADNRSCALVWFNYSIPSTVSPIFWQGLPIGYTLPLSHSMIQWMAVLNLHSSTILLKVSVCCSSESSEREADRYWLQVRAISSTITWFFPDSQAPSRSMMSLWMACTPVTCRANFRIAVWKKMKFSAFQRRSCTPASSPVSYHTKFRPTLPPSE